MSTEFMISVPEFARHVGEEESREAAARMRDAELAEIDAITRRYDAWRSRKESGVEQRIVPVECLARASEILRKISASPGMGAYLYGLPGRGKTEVAKAMLVEAGSGMFVREVDLRNELRSSFAGARDHDDVLDPMRKVGLLVLDDMGKACNRDAYPDWYSSALYDVIDARWSHGLSTVYTSQHDGGALIRLVAVAGMQEALYSRMFGNCEIVRFDGPDRRFGGGAR